VELSNNNSFPLVFTPVWGELRERRQKHIQPNSACAHLYLCDHWITNHLSSLSFPANLTSLESLLQNPTFHWRPRAKTHRNPSKSDAKLTSSNTPQQPAVCFLRWVSFHKPKELVFLSKFYGNNIHVYTKRGEWRECAIQIVQPSRLAKQTNLLQNWQHW